MNIDQISVGWSQNKNNFIIKLISNSTREYRIENQHIAEKPCVNISFELVWR